jgi:hypothetical protein
MGSLAENFFRGNGLSINPLKEGLSPLNGPKLRNYNQGLTTVTIDPSKHTLTINHNGNMGNTDSDVVKNVQALIQKLKAANNADGSYIESIFRKIKPSAVDGSPDYSYAEVYKLPKQGLTKPVEELVDLDNDPTARVDNDGISTVGHYDDKGISSGADAIEDILVSNGFKKEKNLAGSTVFRNYKTGSSVKVDGANAEVLASGKKYRVDLNKINPEDIIKLLHNH